MIKCIKCGYIIYNDNSHIVKYGACFKCFKKREEVLEAFSKRKEMLERKRKKQII